MKDKINKRLRQSILEANELFKEFLAAWMMYTIGINNLPNIARDAVISPYVGYKQRFDPIPIAVLKRFVTGYPHFILEVYQGKFVCLVNQLMYDLFSVLLDEHLRKTRPFVELKTQQVKIDFRLEEDLPTQLKANCARDFTFFGYSKRLKIVNEALNPSNNGQDQLVNIKKHILIRNVLQHSNGIVDDFMLKELGLNEFELADEQGKMMNYTKGDKVFLTIPELYNFMSSFLGIVQEWRVT
jgi:hypothetical protein